MNITSKTIRSQKRYRPEAYQFVFSALRHAQQCLGRCRTDQTDEEEAHISGQELLEGIRQFALQQFGLLTIPVFRKWGIRGTDDFGRIVFELVERGEMRKTEHDQLSDFFDVYSFEEVFDRNYRIDTSRAYRR